MLNIEKGAIGTFFDKYLFLMFFKLLFAIDNTLWNLRYGVFIKRKSNRCTLIAKKESIEKVQVWLYKIETNKYFDNRTTLFFFNRIKDELQSLQLLSNQYS